MRRLFVFLFLTTLFFSLHIAAAQDVTTPWCHQPSGVTVEQKGYGDYHYTVDLGNGPEGIRPVYQSYNHRIVLMKSATREVVQVVDEAIDTSQFKVVSYSPDCRYLAGALGQTFNHHITILWDLSSNPARRVITSAELTTTEYHVEWSPDSAYVVLNTRNEVYLLTLATGQLVRLTSDIISLCDLEAYGCVAGTIPYRGLEWDMANGQFRLKLNTGDWVTYDLASGKPVAYSRDDHPIAPAEAQNTAERLASPFGCNVRVQYQAYNQRLVLEDRNTRKLLRVVEDKLKADSYLFRGWSSNCRYLAAAIRTEGHTNTIVWDLTTNQRIATFRDTVNNQFLLDWSTFGPYAIVETRDGGYLWDVTIDSRVLIIDWVNSTNILLGYWVKWFASENALVIGPVRQQVYYVFQVPDGELRAQFNSYEELCAALVWACANKN
jgi:WD40 repeat protein